nr:hypothetical protein [Tanacetum cinerariifolium]
MISIISAGPYCLTRLLRTSDSKPDMSFDIPASPELLSDPGLDVSFDMPASPDYLSGLAYASLAEKFDFGGWSILITFRFSVGLQTPDDLSRSQLGFIEKMGVHG